MADAQLYGPAVHPVLTELDDNARRVPVTPTVRLVAYTRNGAQRVLDLTPDDAVRLAYELLMCQQTAARVTAERPAGRG